eukprot:4835118-Amphidinium_carterae.1
MRFHRQGSSCFSTFCFGNLEVRAKKTNQQTPHRATAGIAILWGRMGYCSCWQLLERKEWRAFALSFILPVGALGVGLALFKMQALHIG